MFVKVIASGSSGNAAFIGDGKTTLLLDAGIAFSKIQEACGYRLSEISGCLVTHEHADHSYAVRELGKRGIDVYSSAGTFEKLGLSGHRFRALNSLKAVNIGTFSVLPFDVTHDAAEPFGFLAASTFTGEKALYFTDTAFVKYTFSGLTHIIAECNHDEQSLRESLENGTIHAELAGRIAKNHMSFERFTEFLRANDLSRLQCVNLIHLSGNNSHAERFAQEVRRITGTEVYIG